MGRMPGIGRLAPAAVTDRTRSLYDLLAEWSRRTRVNVEVWAMPALPVADAVADAVYDVVAEVLRLVETHTAPRTLSFALTTGRGGLRLTICDDGRGAGPAGTARSAEIMKRCFRQVGGTLTVRAVAGEGLTVHGRIRP
ncbi:hypothetical protein [Sphaerisporangium rufum]|uniref:hypothetical protein n=1 Tax=Sphaerisporangium rufum TaxID=1381558 RepID=UPI00194EEAA0|nr:hypothetical protein [Sphaerisporangium rufum]